VQSEVGSGLAFIDKTKSIESGEKFPVTFNVGLKFTEASRGALMLATLPLWSAWLANIAESESLIWRQIGGIILTFSAVAVVLAEKGLTWQGGAWALVGDLLMLLTAICGAFYGVLAQKMLKKYYNSQFNRWTYILTLYLILTS
jgi:drug/metabolite transporter (DMT)-like permease